MMMVVTVILIVASISTPIYMTCVVRTREAVLRDHLFTMRNLIDRFTLDNHRSPNRLEELVEKGYLGRLPTDPFTGSNETWREVQEDAPLSPEQKRQPVSRRAALQSFAVCVDSGEAFAVVRRAPGTLPRRLARLKAAPTKSSGLGKFDRPMNLAGK
jgi:general secretion pathway protein G